VEAYGELINAMSTERPLGRRRGEARRQEISRELGAGCQSELLGARIREETRRGV